LSIIHILFYGFAKYGGNKNFTTFLHSIYEDLLKTAYNHWYLPLISFKIGIEQHYDSALIEEMRGTK
jgi:hypothetical protein